MHILIAPDSFKESLSAASGLLKLLQTDFQVCQMPALTCCRLARRDNGCADSGPWAGADLATL